MFVLLLAIMIGVFVRHFIISNNAEKKTVDNKPKSSTEEPFELESESKMEEQTDEVASKDDASQATKNTEPASDSTSHETTIKIFDTKIFGLLYDQQITGFEDDLLVKANDLRANEGVTTKLEFDDRLTEAARKRAKEISEKYDRTKRPNGKYYYTIFAECGCATKPGGYSTHISKGEKSYEEAFAAWEADGQGKNAMCYPDLKYIGFGCYQKDRVKYWVILSVTEFE